MTAHDQERVRFEINARAKRIRMRLDPVERCVRVTAPSTRAIAHAKRFAVDNGAWIAGALDGLPPARPFRAGESVPLHGAEAIIVARPKARARIDPLDPTRILVPDGDDESVAAAAERALRAHARRVFAPRLEAYASALEQRISKVRVTDTRSRWGSCAHGGVISMSWRLVCAPEWVMDNVLAHEAAHLRHPDHSADFWDCLAGLDPNADASRAWLRANGPALHAIGAWA